MNCTMRRRVDEGGQLLCVNKSPIGSGEMRRRHERLALTCTSMRLQSSLT